MADQIVQMICKCWIFHSLGHFPGGITSYMAIWLCAAKKGMVFQPIINRVSILAILVVNMVRYLHSSLN